MGIRGRDCESGQSTLEMALACPIVFAMIIGCLELGLAFNAYVTMVAAAREGARAGAVYLYDSGYSQSANDQNREAGAGTDTAYTDNIRDTVSNSLGILKTSSPYFDKTTDVAISYNPSPDTLNTRSGSLVQVQIQYHYSFITRIIDNLPGVTLTAQASARIE